MVFVRFGAMAPARTLEPDWWRGDDRLQASSRSPTPAVKYRPCRLEMLNRRPSCHCGCPPLLRSQKHGAEVIVPAMESLEPTTQIARPRKAWEAGWPERRNAIQPDRNATEKRHTKLDRRAASVSHRGQCSRRSEYRRSPRTYAMFCRPTGLGDLPFRETLE